MKVLESTMAEPVVCNDECGDKNASEGSNQHKLNEIQDLLTAHNRPAQNERYNL